MKLLTPEALTLGNISVAWNPSSDEYANNIRWALPPDTVPDKPFIVSMRYVVSETGAVSNCTLNPVPPDVAPGMDLCRGIKRRPPFVDADGKPIRVRFSQKQVVEFEILDDAAAHAVKTAAEDDD